MNRVAPFSLLLPVFAIISSVLFLGEDLSTKFVVGAVLTIIGVAITQNLLKMRSLRNRPPQPEPEPTASAR